jgi:hypothetical protein
MTTTGAIRQLHSPRRRERSAIRPIFIGASLLFLWTCLCTPSAGALTSLSQGYSTSSSLAQGSIVSLKNGQTDHVEATSINNGGNILGVVVSGGGSLLSLSNSNSSNQVQVATSGVAGVLVSDINGPISQGDQIAASPIAGIGMKATSNAKVIGVAQGTPSNDTKQSYTDASGKKQTLTLGIVDTLISVSYFYKQPDKTIIPSVIQNLANALAGKSVSPLPIIISGAIFVVTLIVVSSIIYSMIRSSIISVGRNPMSQSAVYRDVIQLSVLVLGILVVAVISIYIVLTKF